MQRRKQSKLLRKRKRLLEGRRRLLRERRKLQRRLCYMCRAQLKNSLSAFPVKITYQKKKKRTEKSLSKRRASVARSSAAKRSNNVDPDDGILLSESKTIESDVEGVRAKGGSEIVSADFDENQCCIFFKTYIQRRCVGGN